MAGKLLPEILGKPSPAPGPELEQAHERLLAVHGAVYRGTDSETARENLSRLAQVAALQGHVQDSSHWQRLYIDLQRGLTGVDSPEVVAAQENLIGLFRAAGQTDQALIANAWLMATEEQAWGPDSPRLLPTLRRQLDLLTEAGLKKDARALAKRIKKLEKAAGQ